MSKHYFLGGNTPHGFFSYYEYLMDQTRANKIYCIKGGPGTGKSSFMKKIATHMEEEGFFVEYAHCSSDPKSLDGIIINEKNIAFVDGTSPHIVDPKTPGAVDTILNMGAFWDEDGIYPHKNEIMTLNKEISEHFSHAYKYLASAKCLWDDTEYMHAKTISDNAHEMFADKILKTKLKELSISTKKGKPRKHFATAITPEGIVSTADTITENCDVYTLKGYTGNTLNIISDMATSFGLYTENYYSPMEPSSKIEHLVIPELNLAFVSSNSLHHLENGEVIDFNEYASNDIKRKYASLISYNENMTSELINKASHTILNAKKLHDELEKCYIPYMNFEMVDKEYENLIKAL